MDMSGVAYSKPLQTTGTEVSRRELWGSWAQETLSYNQSLNKSVKQVKKRGIKKDSLETFCTESCFKDYKQLLHWGRVAVIFGIWTFKPGVK